MRRRKPLKRNKPLRAKAAPKPKPWLRADGTPKRGYTKAGKKSKKTLTAAADTLARRACHARGYCQGAGWEKKNPPKTTGGSCQGRLEWAHILSRRHMKIRWMPENCLCLCSSCHAYFTAEPHEFYLLVEILHPGRMDFLYEAMRDKGPIDHEKWIEFYKNLKKDQD